MLPARPIGGRDDALWMHFTPRRIVLYPSEVYMRQEVLLKEEVYLAAFEPVTGAMIEECRMALLPGSSVQPVLNGLFPPVIAISDQGRDTQPFASTVTFEDNSGGILVRYHDPATSFRRVWYGEADIRYKRQTTLLKRKVDRLNPTTSKVCRVGGPWLDAVWVAFDDEVWRWTEGGDWDDTRAYEFPGDAVPTQRPCVWRGRHYWPLGERGIAVTDAITWRTTAGTDAVALTVMGDVLWGIGSDGFVRRWVDDSLDMTQASIDAWAATDDDIVRVDDTCSDIFVYFDGAGAAIPVVVGFNRLYAVNVEAGTALPTGPEMAHHRYPLIAQVLGADNNVYLAQGPAVIQWTGDVATPVGLDLDDGLPFDRRGAIVAMANGTASLFALIDGAGAIAPQERVVFGGTDSGMADQFDSLIGKSSLLSREGNAWVVRAVSPATTERATTLWLADTGGNWRIWFAWGTQLFTIDLDYGLVNPLDLPQGQFEPTGFVDFPLTDYGYKADKKIALMVQAETTGCTATETVRLLLSYDRGASYLPLFDMDGNAEIMSDGVHTFWLSAAGVSGPGPWPDDPAVGREFDMIGLRAELRRGADVTRTPALLWATIHSIKSVPPVIGYSITLDLSREVHGRTPWEQILCLTRLVRANSRALIHFAYRPAEGHVSNVGPVKITGVSGLETTGRAGRFSGRVRLSMSQVTTQPLLTAGSNGHGP